MNSHHRVDVPADGPRRHRAPRRPRLRVAFTGAAAIAVLGGGTAFACMGGPGHSSPAAATHPEAAPAAGWTPAATPTPSPSHPPVHHISGHRPAAHHPQQPRPRTSPSTAAPTAPSATPSQPPSGSGGQSASSGDETVQQVLDLINKARAAQGLPAYTLLDGLSRAAAAHNQVMAGGCGLSHQCPNEPPFNERDAAQGVQTGAGGENIGEGGPMSDTPQAIAQMAVNLTQGMLDEKPPNDGHRQNLLSSTYTHVGIAVYRDSSGTVWLTQDFSQ